MFTFIIEAEYLIRKWSKSFHPPLIGVFEQGLVTVYCFAMHGLANITNDKWQYTFESIGPTNEYLQYIVHIASGGSAVKRTMINLMTVPANYDVPDTQTITFIDSH